ncbi:MULTISPECIES: hypothetical protein [Bacillus]|nr:MULTISPECIES: hypothetical protein [Bacillus]
MEMPKVDRETKIVQENERIGTWFSVGVVATVILLTYVGIFWLYMERV